MRTEPTVAEREDAEAYLRARLDCEHSMYSNMEVFLADAVDRICEIIGQYSVTKEMLMSDNLPLGAQAEIEVVLAWLQETIREAVLLLAKDEREEEGWFAAFLEREYENDWDFYGRMEQYSSKFISQVEAGIAALMLVGAAKEAWVRKISGALGDFYNAPFMQSAIKRDASYFSPKGLGQGIPLDMSKALTGLAVQEVASAWMAWSYENARRGGAIGYKVERGSSYPCIECNTHCGFHPIDEPFPLPVHAHCCCTAVYIYDEL